MQWDDLSLIRDGNGDGPDACGVAPAAERFDMQLSGTNEVDDSDSTRPHRWSCPYQTGQPSGLNLASLSELGRKKPNSYKGDSVARVEFVLPFR